MYFNFAILVKRGYYRAQYYYDNRNRFSSSRGGMDWNLAD